MYLNLWNWLSRSISHRWITILSKLLLLIQNNLLYRIWKLLHRLLEFTKNIHCGSGPSLLYHFLVFHCDDYQYFFYEMKFIQLNFLQFKNYTEDKRPNSNAYVQYDFNIVSRTCVQRVSTNLGKINVKRKPSCFSRL